MNQRVRAPWAIILPALFGAIVTFIPLWYLLDRVIRSGWSSFTAEIFQSRTADLIFRSFLLTATVTISAIVVGIFAAWITTMTSIRGRAVLLVLLSVPLAIPSYLSAFAWLSWIPEISGFTGAFIVLTLACYPFVMLPVAAALRRVDISQIEVARTLGYSPFDIIFKLTLRQVRTAIAGGALLVALYVLSDFGAVAAMRYEVFTWVIYGAYRAGFNPSRAASLSVVLVFAAALLVVAESRVRGRGSQARIGKGVTRSTRIQSRWSSTLTLWAIAGIVIAAGVGVPTVSVLSWVQRTSATPVDANLVFESIITSFQVGIFTAFAAVLLALPIGIGVVRFPSMFSKSLERSTYLSHALPGIVVAISLVYAGIRLFRPIYQELPLLVLGQVVLFLPLAIAAIRTSLEQSPVRLEEVSRSLGWGQMMTIARVTIPIALPGIASGAALVMLAAVKELPTTLLLRPTGTETLATSIWKYSTVSDYAAVGPYALSLMLLAAIPTAVLSAITIVKGRAVR
jgi:iron(III) transport system permease protein